MSCSPSSLRPAAPSARGGCRFERPKDLDRERGGGHGGPEAPVGAVLEEAHVEHARDAGVRGDDRCPQTRPVPGNRQGDEGNPDRDPDTPGRLDCSLLDWPGRWVGRDTGPGRDGPLERGELGEQRPQRAGRARLHDSEAHPGRARGRADEVRPRRLTLRPDVARERGRTLVTVSSRIASAVRAGTRSVTGSATAVTRTSSQSARAHVATTGLTRRSIASPSSSATCDSPIPYVRSVRTTRPSACRPSRRRGRTQSDHITRISRGGPGRRTATRPSGRSTHQPGAVPFGLGMAVADGIRQACFRLTSGSGMLRRAKRPRNHASSSGSTTGTSLMAAASASRVRWSGVGPRPPVATTRSTDPSASRKAAVTRARSSGTARIRCTSTPEPANARASSPPFVSRVSPVVSSLPTTRSSAVLSGRPAAGATPPMVFSVDLHPVVKYAR
jgi:hypothetical protein